MTAPLSPASGRVVTAFGALRRALHEMECDDERRILRDALRDALDRDATELPIGDCETGRVVAGSWIATEELHRGSRFLIERLRHRDLGSDHVLKRIRPEHAGDPLFRAMLLGEGARQQRLRHEALLPAETVLRLHDGSPAIVMPYRPGPSLARLLTEGALSTAELLVLLERLCDGLGAMHRTGLVHGDLTPANILLPGGDAAAALICDFGLSGEIGSTAEGFDLLGTPGFVAPELAGRPGRRDPRQDLFAIGAVLRACLDRLPPAAVPPDLACLSARLCEPDPAARPSLAEVAQIALRSGGTSPQVAASRQQLAVNASAPVHAGAAY